MADTKTHLSSGRDATPDLHSFVGEWVVLNNDVVIAHGPELKVIVEQARARGIVRPRVLYVEDRDSEAVKLGL